MPIYVLIRAKLRSVLSPDELEKLDPVMVAFDDSRRFGMEVEKFDGDKHLVFLPGAPDAWSGAICTVTADRIQHLVLRSGFGEKPGLAQSGRRPGEI